PFLTGHLPKRRTTVNEWSAFAGLGSSCSLATMHPDRHSPFCQFPDSAEGEEHSSPESHGGVPLRSAAVESGTTSHFDPAHEPPWRQAFVRGEGVIAT